MKQKYPYIVLLIFCLSFFEGRGQYVFGETEVDLAKDEASNYNPPNWELNSNEGEGFLGWVFDTGTPNGGFAGNFIGDFSSEINSNGKVFALFANSGNNAFSGATRQFPKAMHRTDQFSVKVAVNFRDGAKGFDLRDSNNNSILNFNVAEDQYRLNDTIILFQDIYDANTVFEFTFTQNENSLDWTVIRAGGLSGTQSGTIAGINSGTINNIRFYNVSAGTNDDGGGARNLFFNDLNFISKYTIPSSENISLDETDTSESAPYVWVQSNASLNFGSNLLQIENTGLVNNLGTLTDLSGTLEFLAAGSISGTVNLHNLEINGGVNLGSSTTVDNECVIKSGSFFVDNAPTFTTNSTLVYDTGSSFNRGIEWNNQDTGNQGTPHNVEIRNGAFEMSGENFTSGNAVIAGDLLITGGTFSMNNFTHSDVEANNIIVDGGNITIGDTSFNDGTLQGRALVANGDFRNLVGSVTLGDEFQGDLKVRGSLFEYLTSSSTFDSQGRAVIFEGGNIINVTSTGEIVIDFVVIDMSGGKVIVDNDLTIQGLSGTGGESGILLHMLDQSTLDLNTHDLTLGDGSGTETFEMVMEEDTQIISTPSTTIEILNNGNTQLRLDESEQGVTNAVRQLIVTNAATTIISNTLHIFESLNVDGAEVDGNDKLIFRSNENQTAVINEIKNGGSVTGNIRVERYFSDANRSFRYVSSPVNSTEDIRANWQEGQNNTSTSSNLDTNPGFGTHITGSTSGSNGFDATQSGNPSMFTWNNITQEWSSIPNTDATNLVLGQAYALMVRGDRSANLNDNNSQGGPTILRSFGEPAFGEFVVSDLPQNAEEFALIGNPYQAQVNIKEVDFSAFNTNFIWIWDPNIGNTGGYTAIDLTQDPVSTTPTSGANELLQPGQAFFIETTEVEASATFQEMHKTNDTENTATFSALPSNILVNLSHQNSEVIDATRVVFGEEYSTEVTFEDAKKLWNTAEYIAIEKPNYWLSVEKKPLQENDTIQLFTGNYSATEYQLNLTLQEMNQAEIFLVDRYLETSIEISEENYTYPFEVDQSIQESIDLNRFQLIVQPIPLSTEKIDTEQWKIYPNPVSNLKLTIELPQLLEQEINIKLYNQIGQEVYHTKEANHSKIHLKLPQLPQGFYLIRLTTKKQSWSGKILIE